MLRISNLTFRMEGRPLLERASVTVPAGHRVGVVGRNGTGKTTLFRLILGELSPEEGEIRLPRGTRIGAVRQEAEATGLSLLETVLAADAERAALLTEAETATDPARIAEIQTRLADISAHSAEARAAAILLGLGFGQADQARPCAEFSGGWRMRIALAATLFARPDLLLLDEPTNYLDLEGTVWLEAFLARYPHTVLLVSHDRGLLNRVPRAILHLHDRRLILYGGNYDAFDRERRARLEGQIALKRRQEAQRAHIQSFVDRFRYKASKARQAQSRLKMLERLEPIAAVTEEAVRPFVLPEAEPLSPPIVAMEGAATGYGGPPVLSRLTLRIDADDRIALLGANGEGKSTFVKLVSGRLPCLAGTVTRAPRLRIGYFAQHQLDELDGAESALRHLERLRPGESPGRLRARLAAAGIGADIVENPVAKLSGGQKARLALFLCTIEAPHLLILDEPTNHLDIESREALVHALAGFGGAVILVSHDPWLVDAVADRLWLVRGGRVNPFEGDMAEYRALLLAERGGTEAPERPEPEEPARAPRPATPPRRSLASLRAELRHCEERVAKIEALRAEIDARLADPALYGAGDGARIAALQKRRAEIAEALERAEALWFAAQERLDGALAGAGG